MTMAKRNSLTGAPRSSRTTVSAVLRAGGLCLFAISLAAIWRVGSSSGVDNELSQNGHEEGYSINLEDLPHDASGAPIWDGIPFVSEHVPVTAEITDRVEVQAADHANTEAGYIADLELFAFPDLPDDPPNH